MARTNSKVSSIWVMRLAQLQHVLHQRGWLIILGIMLLLVLAAVGKRSGTYLTGYQISLAPLSDGSFLLSEAELAEELQHAYTKPLTGMRLAELDLEWIEEALERHPFVAEAKAYVDANAELFIEAKQRNPLLRIIADNGQNYLLDEAGTRMPISERYVPRVLVATGNLAAWNNQFMNEPDHQLSQLFRLAHYLRNDEFLNAQIEQIYVNNRNELKLAPKVGDQIIYLGRYEDELTYRRLERLKLFYREGLPYAGWRKYRSFDLRYADQVVCKKR